MSSPLWRYPSPPSQSVVCAFPANAYIVWVVFPCVCLPSLSWTLSEYTDHINQNLHWTLCRLSTPEWLGVFVERMGSEHRLAVEILMPEINKPADGSIWDTK